MLPRSPLPLHRQPCTLINGNSHSCSDQHGQLPGEQLGADRSSSPGPQPSPRFPCSSCCHLVPSARSSARSLAALPQAPIPGQCQEGPASSREVTSQILPPPPWTPGQTRLLQSEPQGPGRACEADLGSDSSMTAQPTRPTLPAARSPPEAQATFSRLTRPAATAP